MKNVHLCLATVLACSVVSCGRSTIYPVSGSVTCQGAPAAGATIFFQRQTADPLHEHTIMAIVQKDGSFAVVCGSLGKGAPPGEYDVLVEWNQVADPNRGRPQRGPDKLKGRYADPQRPLLHAIVEAKDNQLPPFELSDGGPRP